MNPTLETETLAVPVSAPIPPDLLTIGEWLRTQDNRCTANPMFCVQVRKRMYGMDTQWCSETVWIETEDGAREIPPPADEAEEERYEQDERILETGYYDHWETVMVSFTEEGCKRHLELNGHNYRHFEEVRIYADSFNRCPEMIVIRDFLMSLPKP